MLIRAGFDIGFATDRPVPTLANLSVHPSRNRDLRTAQRLTTSPDVPLYDYVDLFGNVCTRLIIPAGGIVISTMFTIEDAFEPDDVLLNARQSAVEDLPDEVLIYLLGSRYCETDKMSGLAWSLFGGQSGWALVQAICDYAHDQIRFDYTTARSDKTAWDAHEERVGVCRDYAHLAVTLCRAMNVPARYCTGYLGSMDRPDLVGVMDFSAWFEAYLEGRWMTFDARHNQPRRGRILMARGRDATDVALTNTFGSTVLNQFDVYTEFVEQAGPLPGV